MIFSIRPCITKPKYYIAYNYSSVTSTSAVTVELNPVQIIVAVLTFESLFLVIPILNSKCDGATHKTCPVKQNKTVYYPIKAFMQCSRNK